VNQTKYSKQNKPSDKKWHVTPTKIISAPIINVQEYQAANHFVKPTL
jgi:hypothetical protein